MEVCYFCNGLANATCHQGNWDSSFQIDYDWLLPTVHLEREQDQQRKDVHLLNHWISWNQAPGVFLYIWWTTGSHLYDRVFSHWDIRKVNTTLVTWHNAKVPSVRQFEGSKVPYKKAEMLWGRNLAVKDSWAVMFMQVRPHGDHIVEKAHSFWKKLTELSRAGTNFNTHL